MEDLIRGPLYLRKFNGTTDVKEFVKRFKIIAAAKEWEKELQAAWVPVYLSGPAMAFYDTLGEVQKDTEATLNALEKEFTGLENTHF